jgi:cytochrome c biogenesis protein CcdA
MRKIIFILLTFIILPVSSYCKDKVTVTLFFSPNCKACLKIKGEFLPLIKQKYNDSLEWKELNTLEPDNLAMLISLTEKFERKKPLVPSILVGNTFLVGKEEVMEGIEPAISQALKTKSRFFDIKRADLLDVFKKLSVLTVAGSGLIDGINPCAFAVIVFFISFLAVYGYKKKEIICVGTAYCLAVFSTYILIGLGFFGFLYKLNNIYLFIKAFYYFVAFFCFALGVFALCDYFRFKKTGSGKDSILQLPNFFKKRINIVIGAHLREKKQGGMFGLMVSSFVVGFLVSLLEAVCTGQVYLPTIVFILKNTDLKLKAAAYLFLYNLMFIIPLILVFLLSLAGVSHIKFNEFLKRHLGKIKIGMALVFFLLGILIFSLN